MVGYDELLKFVHHVGGEEMADGQVQLEDLENRKTLDEMARELLADIAAGKDDLSGWEKRA